VFSLDDRRESGFFLYPPLPVKPGFYREKILNGVARWGSDCNTRRSSDAMIALD